MTAPARDKKSTPSPSTSRSSSLSSSSSSSTAGQPQPVRPKTGLFTSPGRRAPSYTPTAPPEAADSSWQAQAACSAKNWPAYAPRTDHDPEVFYPRRLEGGQCAPAKAFCHQCPVRLKCLAAGLREGSGVWGGLSEKERRQAQKLVKQKFTLPQILAMFDAKEPKRKRSAKAAMLPVRAVGSVGSVEDQPEVQAAALTAIVVEDFIDLTGGVPVGISLEPSVEVRRERERRVNGLG